MESNSNAPTPVTDSQGNPVQGVNPNGSVSPMQAPAGLPPIYYAGAGELANSMQNSPNPMGLSPPIVPVNLAEFAPGAPMDAQRVGGGFNLAYTSYANYSFGIYTAAAGLTLQQALAGANSVAGFATYNPNFVRAAPPYSSMLQSNLVNVTAGYKAYVNGQVCVP
jgi:hypothetical protein